MQPSAGQYLVAHGTEDKSPENMSLHRILEGTARLLLAPEEGFGLWLRLFLLSVIFSSNLSNFENNPRNLKKKYISIKKNTKN